MTQTAILLYTLAAMACLPIGAGIALVCNEVDRLIEAYLDGMATAWSLSWMVHQEVWR